MRDHGYVPASRITDFCRRLEFYRGTFYIVCRRIVGRISSAVKTHISNIIALHDKIRIKRRIAGLIPAAQALHILIVVIYAASVGFLRIIPVKS